MSADKGGEGGLMTDEGGRLEAVSLAFLDPSTEQHLNQPGTTGRGGTKSDFCSIWLGGGGCLQSQQH